MYDPKIIPPTETPVMIQEKLKEFHEEIERLAVVQQQQKLHDTTSHPHHPAFRQAQQKCPELSTRNIDFQLAFLRSECFVVVDAAELWIKYWDKRLELFGPSRAFLPMTLEQGGALEGEEGQLVMEFLERNHFQLVGGQQQQQKEPLSSQEEKREEEEETPHQRQQHHHHQQQPRPRRGVAVLQLSDRIMNEYDPTLVIKATWYLGHLAIYNNPTIQRQGIIFLIQPQLTSFYECHKAPLSLIATNIMGIFPLNVAALHIIHPPMVFTMIFKLIKLIVGKQFGERFVVHSSSSSASSSSSSSSFFKRSSKKGISNGNGSKTNIVDQLCHHGLERDQVPTVFGGDWTMQTQQQQHYPLSMRVTTA